jgi:hypothetical protein
LNGTHKFIRKSRAQWNPDETPVKQGQKAVSQGKQEQKRFHPS